MNSMLGKVASHLMVIVMLTCSQGARGQSMRVCVDEKSHAPLITSAGGGMLGQLIRESSAQAGVAISFHSAPVARCRERLRLGDADAFPTTPYTPALTPLLVYPSHQNAPDPHRAVVVARALVFRRIGSSTNWNGRQFVGLNSSVLIPTGAALLSDRLKELGVVFDDNGKTLEQNFLKLAAGRAQLAIGAEHTGLALLADPRFGRVIESIPAPFTEEPYYLAVTKTYYEARAKNVELIWNSIERIRASARYRDAYAKAMAGAEQKAQVR